MERVRVLQREQVELISVPVPEFGDGDPADIVHDFQRVRLSQPLIGDPLLLPGSDNDLRLGYLVIN